mmetsp:Transcript_6406/g.5731  ORF Transcript_6406/g.5731 Transcript_6406/m.5731 type:complete len:90 (+) Transcript_6406:439-708(+)
MDHAIIRSSDRDDNQLSTNEDSDHDQEKDKELIGNKERNSKDQDMVLLQKRNSDNEIDPVGIEFSPIKVKGRGRPIKQAVVLNKKHRAK